MSIPVRVLMVTSEWPTESRPYYAPYLVRQVEFLRRAGVFVDVFSFRGARNPFNYLTAWRRLRTRLRRAPYDLIHAQFGQSALLAWPRRLPLVVTFHGCDLQGVKRPDGTMSIGGAFLQRLCRHVARGSDGVILVSERMRQFLPDDVAATVIPTGLDFDEIPLVPRDEARARLNLPVSERLVLFVGNPNETVKRHWLAEQAVQALNRNCRARLVLGWGMPRAEILLLMNACDVLLMTSIQEGSPCVIKEALACNLPIVSLDVGDVPVRIRDVAGCEVCDTERPDAIAAALERVLERHQRTEGRQAVADLDERLLTDQIITVYRSALAQEPRHRAEALSPLSVARSDR
jgi:glycosyltransferase involved in cell wall biosynthesis